MNYGRDYGNRNFLDRAANTVRGWLGNRQGHSDYDEGFRGVDRGWSGERGFREGRDVGYRGWQGGMEHGYGATNWMGRNADWDRGTGDGWGRGGAHDYRVGGYGPLNGAWDADWEDRTLPQRGMQRGGRFSGMRGGAAGYDRPFLNRGFGANPPEYRRAGAFRRGLAERGMERGIRRGYDRDDYFRGRFGYGAAGRALGDEPGGTIGNYGAYGSYGVERFRSGSSGGVPTGQYWTGYGVGSGYGR